MFLKNKTHVIEIQTLTSKHKEADHRITHHSYFASHQHESICIVADDIDVLILLRYTSRRCGCEIYFHERTHSSKNVISYHSKSRLCQYLGTSA